MFKVNNRRHWRRSGVFICLLWTYFTPCSSVSIVNFKQVNADLKEIRGMKKVMRQQLLKNYDKPD